jgi:hypothetical protein
MYVNTGAESGGEALNGVGIGDKLLDIIADQVALRRELALA